MAKDLGDFQTPPDLVAMVLECLGPVGKVWPRVFEPTCGRGNFIQGLIQLEAPPVEIQAIEIQDAHLELARRIAERPSTTRVVTIKANLFDIDLRQELKWNTAGPLLVIGNPPWVTNSQLGALESQNLPPKSNLKGLRGIEALTGYSNFDIAEAIWLKLIKELAEEQPTIALLCKTSVARNVLKFANDVSLPIGRAFVRRVNAKQWFGAAVDACLFCVSVGAGKSSYQAAVYPSLQATTPDATIGIVRGQLIADLEAYRKTAFADGQCAFTWRQGIKHDAAPVMELSQDSGVYRNRLGELVEVEPQFIYPLLKGSDLYRQPNPQAHLSVIVPQRELGMDTRQLQWVAPRLWHYLSSHAEMFQRRRSSIYRGRPPFALFGIGDYSFAQYKVAISGLYKIPKFRAIGPVGTTPVMLDDTGYFLACSSGEQAALLTSLLNDPLCQAFLSSMMFWDSKRPITKRLLQRINLRALFDRVNKQALLSAAKAAMERFENTIGPEKASWHLPLEEILFPDASREGECTAPLFK